MKIFVCSVCGQLLHFENVRCIRCDHHLGYLPLSETVAALEATEDGQWLALEDGGLYRFCRNRQESVCNWMIAESEDTDLCTACRHNRMIPDLSQKTNLDRWRRIEEAKHRLFYSLLRLELPLDGPGLNNLKFDFLDASAPGHTGLVLTGHADGVITLAALEADDVERERRRKELGEPYRTLLGHFRHEIGHFYWDVLVDHGGNLEEFRTVFGDERKDYDTALQQHYQDGPPADWQDLFVTAYASAHPWEDFAETWAHYLHIVDTLETSSAFGLTVRAPDQNFSSTDLDAYGETDVNRLIAAWLPLAFAVNDINRSMGQPDLYPFVITPALVEKLGFVVQIVHRRPTQRGRTEMSNRQIDQSADF